MLTSASPKLAAKDIRSGSRLSLKIYVYDEDEIDGLKHLLYGKDGISAFKGPVGFSDLGEDAAIEKIGPPEKVINAFGPEVIGENVEGKVLSVNTAEHDGRTYYQYELEPPHALITATAAGNLLYLFSVTGNGLQWKRNYNDLKKTAESFRVV